MNEDLGKGVEIQIGNGFFDFIMSNGSTQLSIRLNAEQTNKMQKFINEALEKYPNLRCPSYGS